jgi:hypothetical protein
MGVDAKMFARIKGRGNWLADADELIAAYELASTFGYENFWIAKGGEHDRGDGHHALQIIRPISKEEAVRYKLADNLVGRVVWSQDGEDIVAAPDEQFVCVHLQTRYYSEKYPRGDWLIVRAVAEWLELRFPGCEVWYGGDSSGICAEHFDADRRAAINRYFLSSGHRAYTGRPPSNRDDVICPVCQVGMIGSGDGQEDSFYICDGCGKRVIKLSTSHLH